MSFSPYRFQEPNQDTRRFFRQNNKFNSKQQSDYNKEGKRTYVGRPNNQLECPHCGFRCNATEQYNSHFRMDKHKKAMKRVTKKIKTDLDNLRKAQRKEQNAYEKENKDDSKLLNCHLCKLYHKSLKSVHEASPYHKQMNDFLLPFCQVCYTYFNTPLGYQHHLCDLSHMMKAAEFNKKNLKSANNTGQNEIKDNSMILDSNSSPGGSEKKSDKKEVNEKKTDTDGTSKTDAFMKEENKEKEIKLGGEFCKKLEVILCELCDIYLPRDKPHEEVIGQHCRYSIHLENLKKDVKNGVKSKEIKREANDDGKALDNQLQCVHCSIQCSTMEQFIMHRPTKRHKLAMKRVASQLHREMMKMRKIQRKDQLVLEKEIKDDPDRKTILCTVCRLYHKSLKSEHEATPYHKKMSDFLRPFCQLCLKNFSTPIKYQYHLCDPSHIRKEAAFNKTKSKSAKDVDQNVDLGNYVILDLVGSPDGLENESDTKDGDKNKPDGVKTEEKKNVEIKLGFEYCKKIEVLFCNLCNIYLPRNQPSEEVIRQHLNQNHLKLLMTNILTDFTSKESKDGNTNENINKDQSKDTTETNNRSTKSNKLDLNEEEAVIDDKVCSEDGKDFDKVDDKMSDEDEIEAKKGYDKFELTEKESMENEAVDEDCEMDEKQCGDDDNDKDVEMDEKQCDNDDDNNKDFGMDENQCGNDDDDNNKDDSLNKEGDNDEPVIYAEEEKCDDKKS